MAKSRASIKRPSQKNRCVPSQSCQRFRVSPIYAYPRQGKAQYDEIHGLVQSFGPEAAKTGRRTECVNGLCRCELKRPLVVLRVDNVHIIE